MADDARSAVRAVVADDEPAGREAVKTLLAEEPRISVIGEASNGREAIDLVRRTRPDLLFLDIQMPDADGFGVLDALGGDVPRGVIFVTAHDQHALRAFDVHALDYVLKPFGRLRFRAAVTRALERLRALDALTLQRTLASMAADRAIRSAATPGELTIADLPHAARPAPRRLGVRTGTKTVLVDVPDVEWIEAAGDYARIHAGKQVYLVSHRMQALEQLLDTREFLRIHRSLIVNLSRVRELHRDSDGGGTIILTNGVRLRVARGRWDELERALRIEKC